MRLHAIVLAAAIVTAPLAARAADLVVWWEKGYYAQEDEAVAEIVDAFEHKTDKRVELVLIDEEQLPAAFAAALDSGHPPDLRLRHPHGPLHCRVGFRRPFGRSL